MKFVNFCLQIIQSWTCQIPSLTGLLWLWNRFYVGCLGYSALIPSLRTSFFHWCPWGLCKAHLPRRHPISPCAFRRTFWLPPWLGLELLPGWHARKASWRLSPRDLTLDGLSQFRAQRSCPGQFGGSNGHGCFPSERARFLQPGDRYAIWVVFGWPSVCSSPPGSRFCWTATTLPWKCQSSVEVGNSRTWS